MAYLSEKEVEDLGLRFVGKNVLISKNARIYSKDISIDDNSRIDDFCVISGKIDIGKNVHFAPGCIVNGGKSGIEFADYAGLAYNCVVIANSDDYSGETMTSPTIPDKFKNVRDEKVIIGKFVILGTSSIVLPGVEIPDGVSCGAMTLFNRSVEPWGIYIGNPARKAKERKKDLVELEKQYLEERGT